MTEPVLERPEPAVVTRPPLIGSPAPRFSTRTTMGNRSLDDYRGRWLVFFSHPADFTPVCTSEFVAFSKAYGRFQALGCDLLALSVDSLFSHIAWVRSIHARFGVTVPFQIKEDPLWEIDAAYGMIHPDAADSPTVRATFVIDSDGLIRAMFWYPMSTGRSVEELLRLVEALQTTEREAVSTPEGWRAGDAVIEPAPITVDALNDSGPSADTPDWYYRLREL